MTTYSRREILKVLGVSSVAAILPSTDAFAAVTPNAKRHLVTLSFDDGFAASSIRTAEIHEKYHLSACFNIIATAHQPDFVLPNEYHRWPVGDFGLWNELKARGHEIMMHGYRHEDFRKMTFAQGKDLILRCIDVFCRELIGFRPEEAIFNFPYNSSTPELEEWIPGIIAGFRTGGPGINALPHKGQVRLTCTSGGPRNIDSHLEGEIDTLLGADEGWLIYNAHGLDDEGWGPLSADYLDRLLARLVSIESMEVIPAARALKRADQE